MKLSLIACLLLFVQPVFAQNFGAQEPFHLINIGNGAAALGMGGAYVAVAEDLSALAWNPAGLSHQTGLRLQFDSLYTTGSEEFEVHTNQTGTTLQDYSVHGFQPQSLALTYQMTRGNFIFGPAFGWGRSGLYLDTYEMKDPINGPFTSPIFFAEGTYTYESGRTYHRSGEDIYSFGFSLRLPNRVSIGGVWNLVGGELTQDLFIQNSQQGTQIFFPPDEEPVFGSFSSHRSFVQTTTEKISGNYVNVGILYEYHPKFSFGGAIRFGYTRKREITEFSKVDFDFTGMVTSSYHLESEFGPITIESELPIEFSGGVAIRLTPRIRVAS
ncbi:MAG TPA: hypothetical protein VLH08_20285, partial [Acidobacteriota bacterium]|nr:hypothetical protein [Acidobacteriota bacterium]